MKKTTALGAVAVLAAAIAGGAYFFGFVGQPDEATIQEVDSVSSALTMRMDSLATSAVRMALPNYTRLDSLTSVLESTVWIDVEHGGEYEEQARKSFELKKKEAARAIRQVYLENNFQTAKLNRLKRIIDKK